MEASNMSSESKKGEATTIIHNSLGKDVFGSPYSPIYNTTTYRYPNTEALLDVIEGRKQGYLYTRWGTNPSIIELEQGLAKLERAEAALAFASGMAAISATMLAYGRNGIVCVGDLYGGTQEFLNNNCQALGLPVTYLRRSDLDKLEACLNSSGMLVYCETPANPTLAILDIAELAQRAHDKKALLAVDNTFASPINQRPLELGADLVLHSASKYLSGHSDITAGSLMASQALINEVANWRKNLGQLLSPETAALLSRSLRTLALRISQHNKNALFVAQAMEQHPNIVRVLYPGLESFPDYELAKSQMHGFGGMLTLDIAGGREQAVAVIDKLEVFLLATSLGGVESLVSQPCATSHHGISQAEREQQGITDSMLRLSVGLEDVDDLITDLNQALENAF
jgi:cystathionine gamma-synthase